MDIQTIYRNETLFKDIFKQSWTNYVNMNKLEGITTMSQAWLHANTEGYHNSLQIFENMEHNNTFNAFKNASVLMEAETFNFDWNYYLEINAIEGISNELSAAKHWYFIGKKNGLTYKRINMQSVSNHDDILKIIQIQQDNIRKENEMKEQQLFIENEKIKQKYAVLNQEAEKQKILILERDIKLKKQNQEAEKQKQLILERDIKLKKQNQEAEKQKQLILERDIKLKKQNQDKIIYLQNNIRKKIEDSKYAHPNEKIKSDNINILQHKADIQQQEQQAIDRVKQSSQIKQQELNKQVVGMIEQLEINIKNIDNKKNDLYNDLQVNQEALNSLKNIMK